MKVLYLVLLLLSAVCFAVAAFTRRDTLDNGRSISLVPLGLLLWVLVPLLQTLQSVDD
jgi:hypothetical protein